MINLVSFQYQGDKFYKKPVVLPLGTKGLTLIRGINYDALTEDVSRSVGKPQTSNGAGKTRIFQIMQAFIFNKNPFAKSLKSFVGKDFSGSLEFEDLKTNTTWVFSYVVKDNEWKVTRNGAPEPRISHKATDVQNYMAELLGLTYEDWGHFFYMDLDSLRILIKGRPTERRLYLEEFFCIDNFYQEMFESYQQNLLSKKRKIEELKQDEANARSIEEQTRAMPGPEWLDIQLEALQDAIPIVDRRDSEARKQLAELEQQKMSWSEFQRLSLDHFSRDFHGLEKQRNRLWDRRRELDEKFKRQEQLRRFVRQQLEPHARQRPSALPPMPELEEVASQAIVEAQTTLRQMQEKLDLKREIQQLLPDLDMEALAVDDEDLDAQRKIFQEKSAEFKHHLSLLNKIGDSGECPTCGQKTSQLLEQHASPPQLEKALRGINAQLEEIRTLALAKKQAMLLDNKLKTLKERFEKFPVFGCKMSEAQENLRLMQQHQAEWRVYLEAQQQMKEWTEKSEQIQALAEELGWPEFLEEKIEEELTAVKAKLEIIEEELDSSSTFKELSARIQSLPSLRDIEQAIVEATSEVEYYSNNKSDLVELRAKFKLQKQTLADFEKSKALLDEKLVNFEEEKSAYRVLELMADFYSPSGFKLYELRRRCGLLIEKANYWSQLFFQEPYEWSLSEASDSFEILVKPKNDKATEPYALAALSKGENNRASRVLLFSLLELIPPTKKTNVLILDEIEAHLDASGVRAFTDVVLPKLKETFPDRSVLLVSHLDSLVHSESMDHLWLVERKNRKTALTTHPWYKRREIEWNNDPLKSMDLVSIAR